MTRDFGIGRLLCSTKGHRHTQQLTCMVQRKEWDRPGNRWPVINFHISPPSSTPAVAIYYIPLGPELMRATHKKIQTSAKGWTIRKDGENGYNLCEPNDHQFLHFSSSNVVEEEKLTFSKDHFFICSHRFVSSSQTHSAQPLSTIKCGCMSMGVLYLPL